MGLFYTAPEPTRGGNTLRIGPGDHHRFCEVTSRYVSVCVCQSPRGGDAAAAMRRRDRQTPEPAPLRCGAQRVHLQLVNPFLGTIEKLEQRAMFHAPESRADRCPHARHSHLRQGCSPKKEMEGRLKQDLDKDFKTI